MRQWHDPYWTSRLTPARLPVFMLKSARFGSINFIITARTMHYLLLYHITRTIVHIQIYIYINIIWITYALCYSYVCTHVEIIVIFIHYCKHALSMWRLKYINDKPTTNDLSASGSFHFYYFYPIFSNISTILLSLNVSIWSIEWFN